MPPSTFARLAATAALGLLIVLPGCGPTAAPKQAPEPAPAPAPAPSPPTTPAPPPLGGTLAVMIDNLQQARPQAGVDQAAAVVEALAEGPITRFEVFVDHKVAKIGPVRSLRPYFATLAESLGAPAAHAGGSPDALNMVRRGGWPDLDQIYNAGSAFWRDPHRQAPHNLYTSTDKLMAAVQAKGYSLGEPVPIPRGEMTKSGTPAKTVQLDWYDYSASWTWNGSLYLRSENGTPHVMDDGTRIESQNIAVIVAPDRIIDQAGRRQITLTGSGQGWFFRSGQMFEGTWSRTSTGWFQFSTAEGPMKWAEGPLWIEIISSSSWLSVS